MRYSPSSRVLFVSICSLTKAGGGDHEYDAGEAIASELTPRLARKLLWRREQVRELVGSTSDVTWQGVALPELEYNRRLARGPDFGGDRGARYRPAVERYEGREQVRELVGSTSDVTWQGVALPELEYNRRLARGPDFGGDRGARYRPAVERYEGRFFLGLGSDRADALLASRHHLLMLSGLYGVLRPFEPVQLYSCPLDSRVARLWREDGVLTDVLSSYVVERSIERIIDLTAVDAYRSLVDWEEMSGYGVEVLHCFHVMGAGDYALIPFGQALRGRLLGMPEGELLALEAETRMEGIVFRALSAPASGFPDEVAAVVASRLEEDIVEAHAAESVGEVLGGGNPEPSARSGDGKWRFAALRNFRKDVWRQPRLFERVANAIVDICKDPMAPRGNTVKRLTGDMSGYWRYRLGDFRLVYRPDNDRLTVYCHRLAPRGGAYD